MSCLFKVTHWVIKNGVIMITPREIQVIRLSLSLTQYEFSRVLSFGSSNVSETTIRKWEQGVRKPSGCAESLLCLVSHVSDFGNVTLDDFLQKVGYTATDLRLII
jgi:DNA-binding transcriptional regulator YiaG